MTTSFPSPSAVAAPRAGSDTREKLLLAAEKLLRHGSYGGVSVDDICKEADVRKGSFYHFFESKELLVLALFDAHWEQKKPELEAILGADLPAVKQLELLLAKLVAHQEQMFAETGQVMGCGWVNIGQEMCGQNPSIRAKTEEVFKRYIDCHERLLKRAQKDGLLPDSTDTKTLAAAMWASCLGVMCQAKIQNNLNVLKKELPAVMKRFLTHPEI